MFHRNGDGTGNEITRGMWAQLLNTGGQLPASEKSRAEAGLPGGGGQLPAPEKSGTKAGLLASDIESNGNC